VPVCLIVGEGSRDGERKRSSRSGYERVRRDAETTRYFLRLPGITMLRIWPLDAVHSTGWARVRPWDAGGAMRWRYAGATPQATAGRRAAFHPFDFKRSLAMMCL
jgi:hypothetical protein